MPEEKQFPEWFNELQTQYPETTRELIVSGNIADLVRNPDAADEPDKQYINFREFWEKIFDQREMVILYSIAWGLRFPTREMEERFRKASGFDQADAAAASPLAKAGVLQKRKLPTDPESCLLLIERVLRNVPRTAVMLYFAHHIAQAPVNIERLIQWAGSVGIKESNGIVLLFTDKIADIPLELRGNSGIKTIMVPKPAAEERKAYLQNITVILQPKKRLPPVDENKFIVSANFDLDAFTVATQGMSYQQVLEMFHRSRKLGETITLEYAKAKKREILNAEYGEYLEIIEPEMGLDDIGGLYYVKERFALAIMALKSGNRLLAPMGIILMGPPGTGKTALCQAIAKGSGFNFLKMRNMRNMFVGVSEDRIQGTIYGLKSLYPAVVMNDEGEELESRRDGYGGDSGVTNRLRKDWMEFMGDPKIQGKILIITCTNRPDLIDPAFKRSGRNDDRIPLLLPSFEERKEIFKVIFRFLKVQTSITDFSKAAMQTDERSGADIRKMIEEANRFAFAKGKDKVDEALLMEAIDDFLPSASQADIDNMSIMALRECSSKKLLPPHAKELVKKIKARGLIGVDENIERICGLK